MRARAREDPRGPWGWNWNFTRDRPRMQSWVHNMHVRKSQFRQQGRFAASRCPCIVRAPYQLAQKTTTKKQNNKNTKIIKLQSRIFLSLFWGQFLGIQIIQIISNYINILSIFYQPASQIASQSYETYQQASLWLVGQSWSIPHNWLLQ